jgi:16S rRNA (uracil1498-N3)-methyltransferase
MPLILFSKKIANQDEMILDKDQVQHFIKSLRYQVGDRVKVGSIFGELFEGELSKSDSWKIRVLEKITAPKKPHSITLVQSVIKKENLELIIRKAVELNISSVQLLISEYSSLRKISDNYLDRLNKIAFEAQMQSERLIPLEILAPKSINEINFTNHLVAMEREENLHLMDLKNKISYPLGIWIGPEGGWSESEKELFKKNGFQEINLGSLVLKSETAAIVSLGILGMMSGS